jgi:phage FluMu protein Com
MAESTVNCQACGQIFAISDGVGVQPSACPHCSQVTTQLPPPSHKKPVFGAKAKGKAVPRAFSSVKMDKGVQKRIANSLATPAEQASALIAEDRVALFQEPSSVAAVVTVLERGAKVKFMNSRKDEFGETWLFTQCKTTGAIGFIHGSTKISQMSCPQDMAIQNLLWGGVILTIGVGVTLGTWCTESGVKIFAYGAILVGATKLAAGIFQFARRPKK